MVSNPRACGIGFFLKIIASRERTTRFVVWVDAEITFSQAHFSPTDWEITLPKYFLSIDALDYEISSLEYFLDRERM